MSVRVVMMGRMDVGVYVRLKVEPLEESDFLINLPGVSIGRG